MIHFQKIQDLKEIPFVQQLAQDIWYEAYDTIISKSQITYMLEKMYNSAEILKQIQENKIAWYFVMNDNEKIGFLSFSLNDEGILFLSKIYLKPAFHGKGIGQRTLDFVMENAFKSDATAIQLLVNKQNLKARLVYEKFGFKIKEDTITDIGEGYVMDDYLYEYKTNFIKLY